MANSVVTDPIYLDTFTSDITVARGAITVKAISLWTDNSETRFLLEDLNGVTCVAMGRGTMGPNFISFGERGHTFTKGLVCDVSDCDKVDGKARVCIYLL